MTLQIERPNILLLRPYSHHFLPLTFQREFDPSQHNVFSLDYHETGASVPLAVDEKLAGMFDAPFNETRAPDMQAAHKDAYLEQILSIVDSHDIDLIVPTKEKYIALLADNASLFQDKLFIPQKEVVDLFQHKGHTYDFFKHAGTDVNLPEYVWFPTRLNGVEQHFDGMPAPLFAKAAVSSGGKMAYAVDDLVDYKNKFNGFTGDVVLSEMLDGPEITQNVIVKDGKMHIAAAYQSEKISPSVPVLKVSVYDPKIDELTKNMFDAVSKEYGLADGLYNVDFLKRGDEHVLSEINVGRFGGGYGAFKHAGLNLTNEFLDTVFKTSQPNPSYVPGVHYHVVDDKVYDVAVQRPLAEESLDYVAQPRSA